ncbi:MAG: alginate export family protein [Bacteroidales bacterium]|nr:alginate export family protein [Candidatus Latescibacterota bacterium]
MKASESRSGVGSAPHGASKWYLVLAIVAILQSTFPSGSMADEGSAFKWGFKERVRQAYLLNGFDLSDDIDADRNYIRVRSQLWASWAPRDGWKIHAGLNNEHRHWFKSEKGLQDEDFEIDELIVENFYLSAEKIGGSPFSIVVGRQDIAYGEGFLMMDGGPLDGSRTRYFDAVRVKAERGPRSIEAHFITDSFWDKHMPVVNPLYKKLIEYNETGAGVYYIDESLEGNKLEGYYFYKNEKDEDDLIPESDIHTFGSRVTGKYGDHLDYAAELAYQVGDRGESARKGLGGIASATWSFDVRMDPSVKAGFVYMSGDDPSTDDFEGWNPLYSRFPKWSEMYIYTLAATERGAAYWENLIIYHLNFVIKPVDDITVETIFCLLMAPQGDLATDPGLLTPDPIFGTGDSRGVVSKVKLSWRLKKCLSGHLLWERFVPGDYYFDGADTAHFLRCELMFEY